MNGLMSADLTYVTKLFTLFVDNVTREGRGGCWPKVAIQHLSSDSDYLSSAPDLPSYIRLSILQIDSGVSDSSKMDYKSAKEAFVADNPGTSIWTVNAVSLVGLVSTAA